MNFVSLEDYKPVIFYRDLNKLSLKGNGIQAQTGVREEMWKAHTRISGSQQQKKENRY